MKLGKKAKKVPKFDFWGRMWKRVTILPKTKCWVLGRVEKVRHPWDTTYRSIRIDGHSYPAHRASYAFFKGNPRNLTLMIDHVCERKSCINPDHLVAATASENSIRCQDRKMETWRRWYNNGGKKIIEERWLKWNQGVDLTYYQQKIYNRANGLPPPKKPKGKRCPTCQQPIPTIAQRAARAASNRRRQEQWRKKHEGEKP